ncbi:hypothetical protein [Streptomyces sp. NPDC051569]|uniref:hypothetical protein n=1 Tax=Streptomyces sp. NPDC051569 TaxID=3365661 RepID=UPI0037A21B7D
MGDEESTVSGGLPEELRTLGRGMRLPDVDGATMAERVLAQLLTEAVPVPVPAPPGWWARIRRRLRARWRALAATFSGVLLVLVLTPPVRAAVADWFDFGGVEVRYDPSASPLPAAPEPVPGCDPPVPTAEVIRQAGFVPRLPTELGAPDVISVAEAAPGRSVVSLCWTAKGQTVRLDEFTASLDIGLMKQVRIMPQWIPVGGGTGLWFEEPHELRLRLIDEHGADWTRSVRTAGPTLLWDDGGPLPEDGGAGLANRTPAGGQRLTLRLEGVPSAARARVIAESIH